MKPMDDPLPELRHVRRKIEQICEERGQTYAEYLSEVQTHYTERLVRRAPKPRLKVKAGGVAQDPSDRE